jgi:hypothetical protein
MAVKTPDMDQVLEQVLNQLLAIRKAGITGTITIHCSPDQTVVKATHEHKNDPVRAEHSQMNVIRRR